MVVQKKVPKRAENPKKVKKPKVKPAVNKTIRDTIKKRKEVAEKTAIQQKVEARLFRKKNVEVINEPKTTLEEIMMVADKRAKCCGLLMEKKAFGNRAQGVEELKKEIEVLNEKFRELKLIKGQEDARGR